MTSKKENDVAREARSVACADAPGRDERAVLIGRAAIAAYDNYSHYIGMFDYTEYGAEKPHVIRDFRRERETVLATDDRDACDKEWQRVVAEYVGLATLKAARSESEDTQPKATHTQDDVGVQHVQKLHELDDEATSLQNVQRTYWANKGPTPLIETTFATHGHGYVVPRTDGMKVRCGGPAACERCAADKELLETARALRANTQSRPTQADVDALVKAMEALTEAYGAIHVSHGLDPEESPRYVAARAAVTPFQKG